MATPLHQKIQQDILAKINAGEYAENEIIPTELELAAHYNVSRPTIRQAIQSLVNDGYLEKKRKRGTIVKKPKLQQEFTHVIESFDSEMNRKGLAPATKVIDFTKTTASKEVAENLDIEEGAPVFKMIRLRYADDLPIVLVTTYIPYDLFPTINEVDFTSHLLYATFEALGQPVKRVVRRLETIKADETTSDLLNIEVNDPIFYYHSQGFTEKDVPIEYSISKYRGDVNYFVFEINMK